MIPSLTWYLLNRIQKRIFISSKEIRFSKTILYAFIGALLFGILLSVFFTLGNTEMPFYMVIALFFTALFLPIYKAECFPGFVMGMTFIQGYNNIYLCVTCNAMRTAEPKSTK